MTQKTDEPKCNEGNFTIIIIILVKSFIRIKRIYTRTKSFRLYKEFRRGGEDHDIGYIRFNERQQ